MIAYILEICCVVSLLYLFLGYNVKKTIVSEIGFLCILALVYFVGIDYSRLSLEVFVKIIVPILIIPICFDGGYIRKLCIEIFLIQMFFIFRDLYIGLWIVWKSTNELHQIDYLMFIISELTALLIIVVFSIRYRDRRMVINKVFTELNIFVLLLMILCEMTIINVIWIHNNNIMTEDQVLGVNLIKNSVNGTIGMIFFYLVFKLIVQKKQLTELVRVNKDNIEAQAKQYRNMGLEYETIRKFKHDYNSHLHALKVLSKEGSLDRISEYISRLDCYKPSNFSINTNNLIVDAVVNEYARLCEKNNVQFSVEGALPSTIAITDVDLSILLSNAFRNAYEAAHDCIDESSIAVKIGVSGIYAIMRIENTYNVEPVIINGRICSSKKSKKNRGFGTLNMIDVINRVDGKIDWIIDVDRKVVITEIIFR